MNSVLRCWGLRRSILAVSLLLVASLEHAKAAAVNTNGRQAQAWQREIVYQIYPRSFADANGDGIGDLKGIVSKVEYLRNLGVDAVWLCPVNRTTNFDNGYDVSDYLDIDPTFGTLADWEELRDALHKNGIKIMMDLVLNHSSDAHPWFQQEIRLKNLQRRLPTSPPPGFAQDPPTFRRLMYDLLTGAPVPRGLDLQHEPFSGTISAVELFKQASQAATRLGYPTPEQQLQRLASLVYGTPLEQERSRQRNEDFYIWRDKPNNWTSIFSGSAWHYVEAIGLNYLALFSLHQPDLNWNNPKLRQAMYKMVHTWVKRGVDGFRLDSIGFLGKHVAFPDAPAGDVARMGRGMSYFVNQPQVHTYLRELKHVGLDDKPLRTVGEVSFTAAQVALDYASFERHELTEVFLFDHMYTDIKGDKWNAVPFHLPALKEVLGKQQELIHGRAWIANYLENHDQLRAVSRFGDDKRFRVESGKMLATLLLTLEGTPYIYQGQEIGMTNGIFSRIEEVDDIEARNYYATAVHAGEPPAQVMANVAARNRDNVRTVMQWDDSTYAGFSAHSPWIKVNANYKSVNVKDAASDPNSILAYYKRLIQMRKKNDVFVVGAYHDWLPQHESLYVYTRELGKNKILMMLNFSATPQIVPLPLTTMLSAHPTLMLGNYPVDNKGPLSLTLRPYEARIYGNF